MMRWFTVGSWIALLMLVQSVTPQCFSPNDAESMTSHVDRVPLFLGQQEFALTLLRELAAGAPASNVFFSPHSTFQALLLAYFGSANHTERSLREVLRLPPQQDKIATVNAYKLGGYLRLVSNASSDGSELHSANHVFVSDRVSLRACMSQLFESEMESLNMFDNPGVATMYINKWVEEHTRGQIHNLIPGLARDSKLVLVNAAYFKGKWASKFSAENTRKEVFYISSNKQTLVEMMKQKGNFNYMVSDALGAHVLELPYQGQDISMFILLPPFLKNNGVDGILKRLDGERLRQLLEQSMSPQMVEVELPKWQAETTLDLVPPLENLGIGDAFRSTADYSFFTGYPEVTFDSALHKARIEVDEEGTTAAAATSLFLFRSARPLTPVQFVANHPFVYFLFDRVSQTILFAGVYRDPRTSI